MKRGKEMKRNFYGTLLGAGLALSIVGGSAGAICFPTEVSYPVEDNGLIYKTYQVTDSEMIDTISHADISYQGRDYHFVEMTVEPQRHTEQRAYSELYTDVTDTKDTEQIQQSLPQQKTVTTEDGFSGVLTPDLSTLTVEADTYGTSRRTKTVTKTYPAVAEMDVSYLPATVTEGGVTYTISDCSWDTALIANPYDVERTECYNATATYSATVTNRYAKTYNYDVQYAGVLEKEVLTGYRCMTIFEPEVGQWAAWTSGGVLRSLLGVLCAAALLAAIALVVYELFALVKKGGGRKCGTAAAMLAAAMITGVWMTMPAEALSYTVEGAEVGYTGEATSVADYEVPAADTAGDYSKNTAYVPPAFGTAESYLPNRSEPLIDRRGTDAGGYGVTTGNGSIAAGTTNPDIEIVNGFPSVDGTETAPAAQAEKFTALTANDYYSDGSIGRISIPTIGVSFGVYEGTSSENMKNGAGHFTQTSIWNGNVCLAAHNRGVRNNFGQIQKLSSGDQITLTTAYGTRTYSVYSVRKIPETDLSILSASTENMITLTTCVANERAYRYVVQAAEIR